ncbi:hypothetical protein [Bradyrhizobium sp. Ec3.3]|uniref:hypothetical protein n=1 Tax=Bradyrhizobium sp. Ec3.3 TaxID=189753 RepID=UPI000414D215|nr:hypothetical protein [Bradyrhizobium sp. Ec3.3]
MASASDLLNEIGRITARLAATEAIVVQITAPLLEHVQPGLGRELIHAIRAGLSLPTHDEFQSLAAEEYLQRLADNIEARVRTTLDRRRPNGDIPHQSL